MNLMEIVPFITLLLSFVLVFRVRVVQESPLLTAICICVLVISAWMAFADELGILAAPVIVLLTVPLIWKAALDFVWQNFTRKHQTGPTRGKELPARDRLLMIPYMLVIQPIAGLGFTAFAVLMLTQNASSTSSPAPLILLVIGVCILALYPIMLRNMRRNPWYPVQIKLVRAVFALGDNRSSILMTAINAEPAVESPTKRN